MKNRNNRRGILQKERTLQINTMVKAKHENKNEDKERTQTKK